MTSNNNDLTNYEEPTALAPMSVFGSVQGFEAAQRMAKALATSDLVPATYRGNLGNCLIALELSQRTGSGALAVTQNLHVIEGRPSWSSSFIIAALNSCGRFSPLRFDVEDLGEKSVPYEYWDGPKGDRKKKSGTIKIRDQRCVAWAYDKATGDKLEGPAVTIEMAVREGWYTRSGSKWQTMPDLIIRYRAAAFFGRLYAPDVLMGMHTADEVEDIGPRERDMGAAIVVEPAADAPTPEPAAANENKPARRKPDAKRTDQPEPVRAEPEVIDAEAELVEPASDDEEAFF